MMSAINPIIKPDFKLSGVGLQLRELLCLSEKDKGRAVPTWGNRCGHDKDNPNFSFAENLGLTDKTHTVIKDIVERIEDYYYDPDKLPFIEASRSTDRQVRSERREAIIKTLKALLKHLDLRTMRVIDYKSDTPVIIKNIYKVSGLSFSRFKRAWLTLVHSGLFKSIPQVEKETDSDGNDRFRGLPSIKFMSKKLFAMFSLDKKLNSVQRSKQLKHEQNKNKAKRKTRAQQAAQDLTERAEAMRFQSEYSASVNDTIFSGISKKNMNLTKKMLRNQLRQKARENKAEESE